MQIAIGIGERERKAVVTLLEKLLANEYVLYTKTLKFHWNVYGKHFGALHIFLKEQYEAIFKFVDDVAERIRALGHMSPGTMAEFLQQATVVEEPGKNSDDLAMLRLLLEAHEIIIRQLRTDAEEAMRMGDSGTNNFLLNLLESHEKLAWMLRAHLE